MTRDFVRVINSTAFIIIKMIDTLREPGGQRLKYDSLPSCISNIRQK